MQVEAEIQDSMHLKLRQPLNGEVGSVIVLKVIDSYERNTFLTGSAALLEQAYGDDEPDYSEAGVAITDT